MEKPAVEIPDGPPSYQLELEDLEVGAGEEAAAGNVAVVVASEAHPRAAIELGEVLATSDVPGGVVNILTGLRDELAPHLASHLDIDALDLDRGDADLERAAAENVKRVVYGRGDVQSPYEISSFLELKTVWHPMGQ